MSSHWKFEVHVKTPGEEDDEEALVQQFADMVKLMADMVNVGDIKVGVSDIERN